MRPSLRPAGRKDEAYWHCSALEHVPFLKARFVRQTFPRHTHDTFVIGANEVGAHASYYRGARRVIPQGTVVVVPPGEVHSGECIPGSVWHYRAIYPSAELLSTVADSLTGRPQGLPAFRALVVPDADLAMRFFEAHRVAESEPDPLAAECAMTEVLVELVDRWAQGIGSARNASPGSVFVRRVVDFLNDAHASRITLNDLAHLAGMSRFHFARVFRGAAGLTPYALLTQIRVERAKGLLAAGVPIARAALAVGFCDQSHLTRRFKAYVGVTPGVFASAMAR